jgi:Domain of unknown function (DUF4388)
MILEGNLGAFPFEDILKFVRDRTQSGTLVIEHESGTKRIVFDSGILVFLENLQDFQQLGRGLVGAGVIDRLEYYRLLSESSGVSSDALNMLPPETRGDLEELLPRVLNDAFDDELLMLSTSADGPFKFEAESSEIPAALRMNIPAESLLEKCVELNQQWTKISKAYRALESGVFEICPIEDRDFSGASLSSEEWTILAAINGYRNARDLCRLTGYGICRVQWALAALFESKLVQERSGDSVYRFSAIPEMETKPTNGEGGAFAWLLRATSRTGDTEVLSGPQTLAQLCNRLMGRLLKDGNGNNTDAAWLPRAWRKTLSLFPLADLVVCDDTMVYVDLLTRLRERFDAPEMAAAVLEETERALAHLCVRLHQRMTDEMGSRKADNAYSKEFAATVGNERSPLNEARRACIGLPTPTK